jgi:nucleoside-diphosphate-sugar epimerase
MLDFTEKIEMLTKKKLKKISSPAPPSEPMRTHADISKAENILGYNPNISFEEGLSRMCKWYNEYRKQNF